ncbi:DUF393 domain-containing protein [Undibacterium sp. TS12]|uniref:thiol-disulfide oxidoreductase DCC family protein n=1 Tax=Undibacterium sp. TS12 TaxID=2908202 RepID=UPI001F4D0DDD|nr:DUF393 domain-containing protein [Undibacterium sp. TS12]MCH8620796.1 DUF393 domain-containing protein [Undibacterium sp. TS12]
MTDYPLTLLYDATCPVCKLEMDNLKARDLDHQLLFVDASAPDFDAGKYACTQAEVMRVLHGIKPDGSIVKGVEVIRLAYRAAGLGWITAVTGIPLLKPLFDWAYQHFALNRHHISVVFADLIIHIAAKRVEKRSRACKNGYCTIK